LHVNSFIQNILKYIKFYLACISIDWWKCHSNLNISIHYIIDKNIIFNLLRKVLKNNNWQKDAHFHLEKSAILARKYYFNLAKNTRNKFLLKKKVIIKFSLARSVDWLMYNYFDHRIKMYRFPSLFAGVTFLINLEPRIPKPVV